MKHCTTKLQPQSASAVLLEENLAAISGQERPPWSSVEGVSTQNVQHFNLPFLERRGHEENFNGILSNAGEQKNKSRKFQHLPKELKHSFTCSMEHVPYTMLQASVDAFSRYLATPPKNPKRGGKNNLALHFFSSHCHSFCCRDLHYTMITIKPPQHFQQWLWKPTTLPLYPSVSSQHKAVQTQANHRNVPVLLQRFSKFKIKASLKNHNIFPPPDTKIHWSLSLHIQTLKSGSETSLRFQETKKLTVEKGKKVFKKIKHFKNNLC